MTSKLSNFAAHLRGLIVDSQRGQRINFGELALELFALQFDANPAYRRICEARSATPRTICDWKQIPAVPTTAFKEFELTCLPPEQRDRVFHSSGTTEQRPSRHFHNTESLAVYEASLWTWFESNVLKSDGPAIGDWRLVVLTPAPADASHSSLVHMFDIVRQKLGTGVIEFAGTVGCDGVWELDFETVSARLRSATASHQPVLILGTAFSFVHLLDHLAEAGSRFKLPSGSRVMETGGYKGRSREISKTELHSLVTKYLGVPPQQIICEYGMSELSSQAYDAPAVGPRTFRFPPWARAQIISPETGREVADGESGLLRVLDLANVFSVIAIQT